MKNNTLIGKTIDSKEFVLLKEKDRLFTTLILGTVASCKTSLSLPPMILNDVLK